MFSQVEENYILSLINTYFSLGYKYYLVHTITESDNVYDFRVYFSEEPIIADSSTEFVLHNCVCLEVDSSSRNDNGYYPSTHSRDRLIHSSYNATIYINQAEFIYTNADFEYSTLVNPVNPNILLQNSNSWFDFSYGVAGLFVIVSIFLFLFFTRIFRLRK